MIDFLRPFQCYFSQFELNHSLNAKCHIQPINTNIDFLFNTLNRALLNTQSKALNILNTHTKQNKTKKTDGEDKNNNNKVSNQQNNSPITSTA